MSADAAPAPRLWLGLDLGATNAKAALVSDAGVVLTTHALPLSNDDRSPAAVVEMLLICSQACLQAQQPPVPFIAISAVGVGCPGKCNPNGTVEGIANFPWPPNTPLAQLIEARTGRPVFLTNDAAAVVAAENWVGIGKRVKNFAVLTLGSGVGCGIFNDGVLLQGCSGTIEGGHMIVQADGGRPCGCGSWGCLEAYVSANSVARRATEALDEEDAANPARDGEVAGVDGSGGGGGGGVPLPRSSLHQLRQAQRAVTAKGVFAAAAAGDTLALSVVDRVARVLAVGCINLSRVRACVRACVRTCVRALYPFPQASPRIRQSQSLPPTTACPCHHANHNYASPPTRALAPHRAGQTVDPETIAFTGGMAAAGDFLLDKVRAAMKVQSWTCLPTPLTLQLCEAGPNAGLIGAVAMARIRHQPQRLSASSEGAVGGGAVAGL